MNKWIITLFYLGNATWAATPSALEIMTKNEDVRKVADFQSNARIETSEKGGAPKIKTFTFSRKMQKDGVHNDTFTRFHTPAEVRDEGILIVENESGKNDVLLYLPNFKKVRRVESQQQSGSFMGSVFSYSDIATPHVSDFQYKLLRQEKCNSDEKKNLDCYVIECTPSNEDIQERTGYKKMVIWIRPDNFMMVHGEYYNLEDLFIKKMDADRIKIIDAKNQKWLAHQMLIENMKTHEITRLEFLEVKANQGLPDSIFTQQNLQKVK